MSRVVLEAKLRPETKKKTKELVKEGYVSGAVYGNNTENKNIKFKKSEIEKVLRNCELGSSLDLLIDDKRLMAIIKEIQRDIIKGHVIHMDFQELNMGEKVRVKIPVHVNNKSLVESTTSIVQEQLKELDIQTLPKYLPQSIDVDAGLLAKGEPIKVKDLDIFNNKDVEVLSDPEQIIVLLTTTSMAEAAVAEEETTSKLTNLY